MLKSRNNLMGKKKINSQLNLLKQANNDTREFLHYLQEQYQFSEEEKETLLTIDGHLINLNVIFTKMEK